MNSRHSDLLDRIEAQRGDLRLLRGREVYLGMWIVVETRAQQRQHLLRGSAGGTDDEDVPELALVEAVRIGELRQDRLRGAVHASLLSLGEMPGRRESAPQAFAVANLRMMTERLVPVFLVERKPDVSRRRLQRGPIAEWLTRNHAIDPPRGSAAGAQERSRECLIGLVKTTPGFHERADG